MYRGRVVVVRDAVAVLLAGERDAEAHAGVRRGAHTGLSEPRDVSRYAVVVMAPVVSVEWESVAEAVSAVEPKSKVASCR